MKPPATLRYALGAALCAVIAWVAFEKGRSVPFLELVDLAFHEVGHFVTYAFSDVVTAMAGSVAQVAVPLGLGLYFLIFRRDVLGAGLCFAWAAASAHTVSVWIANPGHEDLPLVGSHDDWGLALGPEHLDALDRAGQIADRIRDGALALAVAGFLLCASGPFVERRRLQRDAAAWLEANAADFVWSPAPDDFDAERVDRSLR
jgi:hypothetical protein